MTKESQDLYNYCWEDHIFGSTLIDPPHQLTPKFIYQKNNYFRSIQRRDFQRFLKNTKSLLRRAKYEGPTKEIAALLKK